MPARYAIGIDLGTSNTALAYADLSAEAPVSTVCVFEIDQLCAPGEVAKRPLLPSAVYLAGEHDLPPSQRALSWGETDDIVGTLALAQGARVPERLVVSSKSWLCHPRVDRTAAILPWGASAELAARRLSPVDAAARVLAHLRNAWNAAHPTALLENQDVVLTVPASFDAVARELTLAAAHRAGIVAPTLLEEPQAAFYDWTRVHNPAPTLTLPREGGGNSVLVGGDSVLVIDVGGGTTDLTLVLADWSGAAPTFERVAVGDHLLLGGDNMDGALARLLEPRLSSSGPLDAVRWAGLVQAARVAKELLLRPDAPASTRVSVAGRGSGLVRQTISADLSREEARATVLDGFFPRVDVSDVPHRMARAGLKELGLPYASEPAITRHIAAFLQRHKRSVPESILLNGGALKPTLVAERLVSVLSQWAGRPVRTLVNDAPDLAVARGAAQFALARRGLGLRIGGGSPRAYYVGIAPAAEGSAQAVCVVPRGLAEGETTEVGDRSFRLLLGKPAQFALWQSTSERTDHPGDIVCISNDIADDFEALAPLTAALDGEGEVSVRLKSTLTAIGTLELWCVAERGEPGVRSSAFSATTRADGASDERRTCADSLGAKERAAAGPFKDHSRWKLEFSIRENVADRGASDSIGALPRKFEEARELVRRIYGNKPLPATPREVKDLSRDLERVLGERSAWSTAVNRELWSEIWAGASRRRRSADHERTFVQLAGYTLRPGCGYPLDTWRAAQLWALWSQGLQFHQEAAAWAAWWVLWRRVAGGLEASAQQTIFDAVAPWLRPRGRGWTRPKGPPPLGEEELLRTLGALERLSLESKREVGDWFLARTRDTASRGAVWALGRLGARVPLFGSAHQVLPLEIAARYAEALLVLSDDRWKPGEETAFAAAQIARRSGDRARDLAPELAARVAAKLERAGAPTAWRRQVDEIVPLEAADAERAFGERLPAGLRI